VTTVRCATYNVHRCVGNDGGFDPERIIEVLKQLDADVLALQELLWDPLAALHLLDTIAERLGYTPIAGPTLLRAQGHYGNAILTRLKVEKLELVDLSVPGREPRGAIDATLQTSRAHVRVVATHLGLAPGERRTQMRRLLALLTRPPEQSEVLMGDLNEWFLWGRPLRWLHAHFGKTPAPATFPAARPLFALDRIWIHPRRRMRSIYVLSNPLTRKASDHLPLVAEMEE
jgi:endonuclease/exonuclease/phosphatase family metal-dependent hydrolase